MSGAGDVVGGAPARVVKWLALPEDVWRCIALHCGAAATIMLTACCWRLRCCDVMMLTRGDLLQVRRKVVVLAQMTALSPRWDMLATLTKIFNTRGGVRRAMALMTARADELRAR